MTNTRSAAPTDTHALDAIAVRELAVGFNHAYLVRAARFDDFDVAVVEAEILTGDVVVAYGQARQSDGRYTVWAAPVVKMPADSPLGEFAHIGDRVEATVRLPKGMPHYKAGAWWAAKHFGGALPVEYVDDVR